ncbi:MAG: SPFH domain-containing protein [Planctomycetota bacterium]|jgi:regulator of protease activity HflC (stomatin/prohibitin superfamily)
MRTDHHAFQRATRVAGFGLLLQAAIGLILLVFGLAAPSRDTTFLFASAFVLCGVLAWLGLIIVFYQHTLERLESLEEDELASARGETGSIFEGIDETRVAARRLALMHKWLMPALSLLLVGLLGLLIWVQWLYLRASGDEGEAGTTFFTTPMPGWAVAICLGFALVSFIFSRFVAGMAKQPAWQNLRGGAGFMVGNAIVMMGVAVGITFLFFGNEQVIEGVAVGLCVFEGIVGLEIVFNFILNLYRPRIPGEVPRPAFDSRILSFFAAPDNLVRSINEAINYQFGFDITSSWGYQLLLRSFVWLLALGAIVLIGLNTMVVVEPQQQALKLAGGAIVGEAGQAVHGSGIMWKLPWPLESAEVYDVSRIRELPLTARRLRDSNDRLPGVRLWTDELQGDREFRPFLVGASRLGSEEEAFLTDDSDGARPEGDGVSSVFALVDAEIILQYRIRDRGGLLQYLRFATDDQPRRSEVPVRQQALKQLALRQVSLFLAEMSLDEVLGRQSADFADDLRRRVQAEFDLFETGVEVVAVNFATLRPAGDAAASFEELAISNQAKAQLIADAERRVAGMLTGLVGNADRVDELLREIELWEQLRDEFGRDDPATIDQRVKVEQMLLRAGGMAAQTIADAERDRWVQLMEKRARARRIENQLAAYRAAPKLYRQREIMRVYGNRLPALKKFVIGIDPRLLRMDTNLTDLAPNLGLDLGTGGGEAGDSER